MDKRRDSAEIVAIGLPIIAELVAVCLFLGACFVGIAIYGTRDEPQRMHIVHQAAETSR